jgi:hypothetical protein
MSCEIELKLQQCLRNATSVRVLAEARLETTCPDERSFASLWDEFVVAKEAWASRVFARQIHMRSCAQCKANPLRGAKTEPPLGARLTGLG